MIRISPRACARVLFCVVGALVLASVPAPLLRFVWGHDYVHGFVPFADRTFHLSVEATPAAWFSSLTLAACALMLGLIGRNARTVADRYARHWSALGWIFLYLSLDEAAALHERLSVPVRALSGVGGFLYLAWVIPAGVLVAVIGLAYLRFLRDLPPRTRALFVTAGALYVGGALGLELIEGYYADQMGSRLYNPSATRVVLTHIEETMEMAGTVTFLYALLDYLGARSGGMIQVAFAASASHGGGDARRRHPAPQGQRSIAVPAVSDVLRTSEPRPQASPTMAEQP